MMPKLTEGLSDRDRAALSPQFFENEKSYWRMRESLLAQSRGKWVAVQQGRLVAEGEEIFEILDRVKDLGGDAYVACVGEEERPFVVRAAFSYDRASRPFPLPRVVARFAVEPEGSAASFGDVIPDTGADLSVLPFADGDLIGIRSQPRLAVRTRGVVWSFDHFDTLTVAVPDAPRADEIVVVIAVADGGRPRARVGKSRAAV